MTIEIADRLIKLRKQYGYSQEELADKLGLSRQAVSKWERAEASPDTDNLICLAKLYGVSLDELLSTDEDVETIVEEQVKKEEPKEANTIELTDDEGNTVVIKNKEVVCKDKNGNVVKRACPPKDKFLSLLGIIEGALCLCALIAFILIGTLAHSWYNAWIVFFVPEIVCSLARAIYRKNANKFNMPVLALTIFFFVCMVIPGLDASLWHPMWLIFLTIPLYYMMVTLINKVLNIEEKKDE